VGWYFVFFLLSGFCCVLYEMVWLRLSMAQFGVTTAMVSIVVSVFMTGLGLCSWISVRWLRQREGASVLPALRRYALIELVVGIFGVRVPCGLALGGLPMRVQAVLLEHAANFSWFSKSALACKLIPGLQPMRILRTSFSLLLFLTLAIDLVIAQELPSSVSDYVKAEMERQHIPGLSLLVARSGKVVLAQGFGLANVELQVPVKPETIFQSGSVGKQFTATALMMLVEAGKVGLDDPLTKYFKDAPPAWNEVTVRELLSHTGGFGDYPKEFDFRKDWTEDELLKLVEGIPLAYPPGTKWEYSNLGYLTLGILMHRVTREFYGDFLQQRIFQPLEMKSTRIISEADIIPNRAAGYRLVKGELKNQEWVAPKINTTADGSLYFSTLDLAKWDAALYTERLLKKSSLDQMWTVAKLKDGQPNKGNYGFGWFIDERHGHRCIHHDGAWQGFQTAIDRYVDDQLTVIALSNLSGSEPGKITLHVAHMILAAK